MSASAACERVTIAVSPPSALRARPRLRHALEAAFPVRLRALPEAEDPAALIMFADDPAAPLTPGVQLDGLPVLVVGDDGGRESRVEAVVLGTSEGVDRRLHGIALAERPVGAVSAPSGDVLGAGRSGPVWTRSPGPTPVQRVRGVLPELGEGEVLYRLLSLRPVVAVALIQFLRSACEPVDWRPPPLRASFVFDDPNLCWRRYGFIDYRTLVAEAERHGYHAAMALIPLDAARRHEPTVSLFRRHRTRLSLVFHGNDHLRDELLRPRDAARARAIVAQAVRRIEGLERRTGLSVDRVMMPPHGLCSEQACHSLAVMGFDALCAIHALPWTAEPPRSPLLAAWRPAGFVGGCAVLPRMSLNLPPAAIALSAFLDHPLVIYGHHDDLADGLGRLAETAAAVSRLGDVHWMSVGEIATSNLATRVVGDRLHVRMYARRVHVQVPSGVCSLSVERPESIHGQLGSLGWSIGSGAIRRFEQPDVVAEGESLELRLRDPEEVDPASVAAPARNPWPPVRRLVAEARDRSLPLRTRLARKISPAARVDGAP